MKSRVVLLVALVLSMGGCVMFDRTGPMTWPAPESFEPAAELPDPLVRCDGSRVDSAKAWGRRRAEIIGMMSYYQYGHMPPAPERILVENRSSHAILDGAATETPYGSGHGPGPEGAHADGGDCSDEGRGTVPGRGGYRAGVDRVVAAGCAGDR